MVIGQKNLKKQFEPFIMGDLPRFSIIVGEKGSGRKLIAKWLAGQKGIPIIKIGTKVDEIREMISISYKQALPVIYFIPDADKMRNEAKNALLKVTEEPPKKAYFIMTLQDENQTLSTIKSRAMIFKMQPYSPAEITEYISKIDNLSLEEIAILEDVCKTPGEVIEMQEYNIIDFYDFCIKVVENIGKVSGANAFKLAKNIKLKEDGDGYSIKLFFKIIIKIFCDELIELINSKNIEKIKKCNKSVEVTSKYLQELNITGINKSMLLDNWILDLRGVWA